MSRNLLFLACAVFLIGVPTVVIAGDPNYSAGTSNIGHIYMYQMNPSTWQAKPDGAWGKLQHNLSGPTFDFVFNAHELSPNTKYSLVSHFHFFPGSTPGILIDSGSSDASGSLHLTGSREFGWSYCLDCKMPTRAIRVRLVRSSDYDPETNLMTAWNPGNYLFEDRLIGFIDTGS